MHTTIGDGRRALFWEDRWLDGYRIEEFAPNIHSRIPKRIHKLLHVKEVVTSGAWAHDVGPDMDGSTLVEFMELWARVGVVQLHEGVPDVITWAWKRDGGYSARLAYAAKFMGREVAPTAMATWKSRASLQCRFFLWLVFRNRC